MKIKLLLLSLLISASVMADRDRHQTEYYRGREPLPEFVYNDSCMVFGVSDPAMDSVQARSMAVTRALFVYAMSQKANLRMMSDYYTKNSVLNSSYVSRHEKNLTLATFSIAPVTYRYNIVDEHVNDRGETFVVIDVTEYGDSSLTLSASCDFMTSYNRNAHERTDYKILMTVNAQSDSVANSMDFSLRGTLRNPIVTSKYGSHDHRYYRQSYSYRNEGSVNKDLKQYPLENALWCSIAESLCDNIVSCAINEVTVENLSETFGGVIQDMSREIVNCNVSCRPKINGIHRNKLSIEWIINKL